MHEPGLSGLEAGLLQNCRRSGSWCSFTHRASSNKRTEPFFNVPHLGHKATGFVDRKKIGLQRMRLGQPVLPKLEVQHSLS